MTILIADRNPHVRDFLRREMSSAGHKVRLAKSAKEVLDMVFGPDHLDLAVVDPDLPDLDGIKLIQKLEDRIPPLPVVIHSFTSEENHYPYGSTVVAIVEKRGNSVERLKRIISHMLTSAEPEDTKASRGEGL